MIKAAIRLDLDELIRWDRPAHIEVTRDKNGNLAALSWPYDCALNQMAKRQGAVWDRDAGGWTFGDSTSAQELLVSIAKRHPDWPIIGDSSKPFSSFAGTRISRIALGDGLEACLIPFPLPYFAELDGEHQIFKITTGGKTKNEAVVLIGTTKNVGAAINSMVTQGAAIDGTLAAKWAIAADSGKVQVKVSGWAVQISCNLADPQHYLIAPEQEYRWEGTYPYGTQVTVPWTGVISVTRKTWPDWKRRIKAAGLEWEGDDPEAELTVPSAFDEGRIAGWNAPAPNGHLLHTYQKEGARFCASRGMRALISDEMGVGKTAQAIAAAEGIAAPRILIICPANARYVWEREIRGWGGRGAIQHITNRLENLDLAARWHILTYDLIATRAETWRLNGREEENALLDAYPTLAKQVEKNPKRGYPRKVTLEKPLENTPAFADPKRVAAWGKMMQRLRGTLLGKR